MPSKTRYHRFRFMSRTKPDLVMGERVIVEAPLPPMTRGPQQELVDHTTVHGFVRHVERCLLQLYERYGTDIDDFELKLEHGYPVGVYYSRPMDELELLEIREWRKRMRQLHEEEPASQKEPAAHDLESPAPVAPAREHHAYAHH